MMPLLSRISNKTLSLREYKISTAQCKALAAALSNIDDLNRLCLENCGLLDTDLSIVLEAFAQRKNLKSLVYKKN